MRVLDQSPKVTNSKYDDASRCWAVTPGKRGGSGGGTRLITFSKIQLVVYYQCCVLIG